MAGEPSRRTRALRRDSGLGVPARRRARLLPARRGRAVQRRRTFGGSLASMSTSARSDLGRAGERLALEHLERLGYALVARNHRTRFGELDLVVADAATLVFAEVKTRRATASGRVPWEALHARKQRRVRAMAAAFLGDVADRPRTQAIRFDAIGVVIDAHGRLVRLDHLEGAF
jgi:putative endonuclease